MYNPLTRSEASIYNRNVIDEQEEPKLRIDQVPFRFRVLGLNSQLAFRGGVSAQAYQGGVSTSNSVKVDQLLESLSFRQKAAHAVNNHP